MQRAQTILEQVFGYKAFRHDQGDIIETLIGGGDVLTLMPTGGGKSLCYQIPALVREGTGIVVSPLIALMQDQVDALDQLGVNAAFLNSTLDPSAQRQVDEQLLEGKLDLLYVAPERLVTPRMLELLADANLALFAIDEAHCVSQWGHDFRPEYRQLSVLAEKFDHVPRIALTATADLRTRAEIIDQLQLGSAKQFVSSFDRPNIRYIISEGGSARERLWRFLESEHAADAGIIYCLSRKKVEDVAEWLSGKGRVALPYHAGLSGEQRREHQMRFLREDNVIIVATIAFGMGIDKPDVRFVAHLNLPKSIEAYYQETGRAGRDGEASNAWLAYGLNDAITYRQWIEQSDASEAQKHVERHKLDALLGLCELTGCRRNALLAYLGETYATSCGNCDNCLFPPETIDGREFAQKALSAVYRTGQRFGVNYVVKVLRGAGDERVSQNGHDKISTFGIGGDVTETEWRGVFRQLISRGFLVADPERYGGLRLTETCRPILRGDEEFELRKARRTKPKKKDKRAIADVAPANQPLWQALRELRLRLAKQQKVPPYVICHDRSLKDLVAQRPADTEALYDVTGFGKAKVKRYGEAFIETVRSYEKPALLDNKLSDDVNHTLALHLQDLDADAIAAERDIEIAAVHEHFAEAIEAGLLAANQALELDEGQIDEIISAFERFEVRESGQLTPTFEALEGRYAYGVLKCVLADVA